MRTGFICSTMCLVVLGAAVPIAQQAPVSIRGRVVAPENDRALPRARVVVSADGHQAVVNGITAQTIAGAEVVMSNGAATVSGHVTDSASAPVASYSVIVFSTDRSKWLTTSRFLRLARPTQDGSFEVSGLPPGEYFIAATDPVEGNEISGDWLKLETLEQLSFRARRVTLAERERYMTVLRLIRRQ